MPRFVILEHDHPVLHWDLMLEAGDVLRTWRLSAQPRVPSRMECESIPDHRIAYLDYEGSVSGGRGEVRRVAAGEFSILSENAFELIVELHGRDLDAIASLKPPQGAGVAEFASNPSGTISTGSHGPPSIG